MYFPKYKEIDQDTTETFYFSDIDKAKAFLLKYPHAEAIVMSMTNSSNDTFSGSIQVTGNI